MNYALLDHPEVTTSITLYDLKAEYAGVFGKYDGQVLPSNDELEKQLTSEKSQSPSSAPTTCLQSQVVASDLNFTGRMEKRVIDDIITSDLAM